MIDHTKKHWLGVIASKYPNPWKLIKYAAITIYLYSELSLQTIILNRTWKVANILLIIYSTLLVFPMLMVDNTKNNKKSHTLRRFKRLRELTSPHKYKNITYVFLKQESYSRHVRIINPKNLLFHRAIQVAPVWYTNREGVTCISLEVNTRRLYWLSLRVGFNAKNQFLTKIRIASICH